jgi:hypothetical protein
MSAEAEYWIWFRLKSRESNGDGPHSPAVADGGHHTSHSISLCMRTGRLPGRFVRIVEQDRRQSQRQGLV